MVFLDANVLFSAAWMSSSTLRRLWTLPGVQLCTSAYAAEEARRNLPTVAMRDELERLLSGMTVTTSFNPESTLPDNIALVSKDRPILAGAIQCGATHLLTGDRTHFGALYGVTVAGVLVLPPDRYLRGRL